MSAPDLTEACRLFDKGLKLCRLERNSKQPHGKAWNLRPVGTFDEKATGYGVMLAVNGLCSVDPDNADLSAKLLAGLGFELDSIMTAGVRALPGHDDLWRSAFKAAEGLRWVKFSFAGVGTVLELRADSANLQDVIPGLVYADKSGGLRTQTYANGKRLDDAPDLPADLLAWWRQMSTDVGYLREQQRKAGDILGVKPQLAISGGKGDRALAFPSPRHRREFNAAHTVPDLLVRHGYDGDGERFAPPTATGKAGVRAIPGKDDLWQSDHASDPLWGTFDAWTAFVVLDHEGDLQAAEAAVERQRQVTILDQFEALPADPVAGEPAKRPKFASTPIAELLARPSGEEFIEGVLQKGEFAVVYGEWGSGKSFLVLDMCLAIAGGLPWAGRDVIQGRVTYVGLGAGGFLRA
jgi:hypothetical protein